MNVKYIHVGKICILKSNNIALQLLPQRLQTSHAKSRLVHSGFILICQPHSRGLFHEATSMIRDRFAGKGGTGDR